MKTLLTLRWRHGDLLLLVISLNTRFLLRQAPQQVFTDVTTLHLVSHPLAGNLLSLVSWQLRCPAMGWIAELWELLIAAMSYLARLGVALVLERRRVLFLGRCFLVVPLRFQQLDGYRSDVALVVKPAVDICDGVRS
jgi:hypothetical protein